MATSDNNSNQPSKPGKSKRHVSYILFGLIFGITSGLFLAWLCSFFQNIFLRLVIGAILGDLLWLFIGQYPWIKRLSFNILAEPAYYLLLIRMTGGKTIIKIWGYTGFGVGLIVGGFASWSVGLITGLLAGSIAGWLSEIELTDTDDQVAIIEALKKME